MPRTRHTLVVQHEEACPPGLMQDWADRSGVTLDVRACHRGDPLPVSLVEHSGVILLGGEMGAYDDARFPWLTAAKSLVIQSVIQSVPFLGLCLGHQLAAVALGGRVAANPHGPRRGIFEVGLLPAAAIDPVVSALPAEAPLLHWNNDIVSTVPGGATVRARDDQGHVQILQFAQHAWGIQGHPEVDDEIVARWGRSPSSTSPSEQDAPGETLAAVRARQDELRRTWWPVAERFFEATKRPGPGPGSRSVIPLPPPPPGSDNGRVHHR